MAWRRLTITLAIIAPILWLLAFGFQRDPRYINSPLMAKEAVPFTITLFDSSTGSRGIVLSEGSESKGDGTEATAGKPHGRKLTLADLRGKAVFLNFWASWCPPCRAEAKDLEAAWQKVKDKNMVFIGVALQDIEKDSRAFLEEFGVTYPNGRDESGKIAVDYGVWGIPESFFIDPHGRITYKHVGGIRAALVISKLEEAAKGILSAQEGRGEFQSVR